MSSWKLYSHDVAHASYNALRDRDNRSQLLAFLERRARITDALVVEWAREREVRDLSKRIDEYLVEHRFALDYSDYERRTEIIKDCHGRIEKMLRRRNDAIDVDRHCLDVRLRTERKKFLMANTVDTFATLWKQLTALDSAKADFRAHASAMAHDLAVDAALGWREKMLVECDKAAATMTEMLRRDVNRSLGHLLAMIPETMVAFEVLRPELLRLEFERVHSSRSSVVQWLDQLRTNAGLRASVEADLLHILVATLERTTRMIEMDCLARYDAMKQRVESSLSNRVERVYEQSLWLSAQAKVVHQCGGDAVQGSREQNRAWRDRLTLLVNS